MWYPYQLVQATTWLFEHYKSEKYALLINQSLWVKPTEIDFVIIY